MSKQTIACFQGSPVLFDKEKSLEKVVHWMAKAAKKGVNLLLFPESFIPAYPAGLGFGTVVGSRTESGRDQYLEYWEQSVEVPGKETAILAKEAKRHKLYLVIGVTEKDKISKSLYCTLLYFSPEGVLLGKHRKLKPTAAERLLWAEGDGKDLTSYSTALGKLGGLICWENYMPLARMALYEQGIELYMAPTADSRESWISSMVHIACEGRCYVMGCNQVFSKRDYPPHLQSHLAADRPEVLSRGGSLIVSPLGKILAGPLWEKEGLLLAEYDHQEVVRSKMDFDVIGHYSRNDVFRFSFT